MHEHIEPVAELYSNGSFVPGASHSLSHLTQCLFVCSERAQMITVDVYYVTSDGKPLRIPVQQV